MRVTTIEGIGNRKIGYHPIQKALHESNGTQCGYCSPGMVMNMYSLLEANGGRVSATDVENSFGGNICRCTGYRPILDAFKSLAADELPDDIEDLTMKCCTMKIMGACKSEGACERFKPLDLKFNDNRQWIGAETIQNILDILKSSVQNLPYMLVAGNTAHGVYRRSDNIQVFIDVNRVAELHGYALTKDALTIGANVNLTETMRILQEAAGTYREFSYCDQMTKHIDLIANVPVRNVRNILHPFEKIINYNNVSISIFIDWNDCWESKHQTCTP